MADLTDKEITEACARAMGIEIHEINGVVWCDFRGVGLQLYHPLQDDAQAMALVKKLRLRMQWLLLSIGVVAEVQTSDLNEPGPYAAGKDADLNRAICLCAARVQIEKEKNA